MPALAAVSGLYSEPLHQTKTWMAGFVQNKSGHDDAIISHSCDQERNPCQVDTLFLVMRGLDPRIHADWPQIESAAWIAGSSPETTDGEV